MMTVVTQMTLRQGSEPEWDATMRDRLANAARRPGFVRSQLLMPLDGMDRRVIVGTWATRADWEAWHDDEAFRSARQRLEELQEAAGETSWFEVVEEQAAPGVAGAVDTALARARELATQMGRRIGR